MAVTIVGITMQTCRLQCFFCSKRILRYAKFEKKIVINSYLIEIHGSLTAPNLSGKERKWNDTELGRLVA